MKKNYFTIALILCLTSMGIAQEIVTVDATADQLGYGSWYEINGTPVAGSTWGVLDLKTVVDPANNTLTLQPNFNTYADNPGDPYWVNQTTLLGNKIFEGSTFVESFDLVGTSVTFEGSIISNTLSAEYEAQAFIKVFNNNFSVLKDEYAPLGEAGTDFTVTFDNPEDTDFIVQYGFYVKGINANPTNEAVLGSVVVTSTSIASVNDFNTINVSIYPNPTTDNINIQSDEQITNVVIYNTLGQVVKNESPDATNFSMETANLDAGIYFAKLSTEKGSTTVKFLKE